MILAILLLLTEIEGSPGAPVCTTLQSDCNSLGGIQAVIEYDPTLLAFQSFSAFKGLNYYNNKKRGEISFAIVHLTPALPSKIAEVCFQPLRAGTGELKLGHLVASNTLGRRLELETKKIAVKIE